MDDLLDQLHEKAGKMSDHIEEQRELTAKMSKNTADTRNEINSHKARMDHIKTETDKNWI